MKPINCFLLVLILVFLTLPAFAQELMSQLSPIEKLVYQLATYDTDTEEHALPTLALEEFSEWTKRVLIAKESQWNITTVRKPEGFEFIEAINNGLIIRQLPEIILIQIPWVKDKQKMIEAGKVLELILENIKGEWANTEVSMPKTLSGVVFLSSKKTFFSGTYQTSFIAIIVNDKISIALPKKKKSIEAKIFSFSISGNRHWFSASIYNMK